jgi:hypothetical protein
VDLVGTSPAVLAAFLPHLRGWVADGCPADYPPFSGISYRCTWFHRIPTSPTDPAPVIYLGDPAEVLPKAQALLDAMEALT